MVENKLLKSELLPNCAVMVQGNRSVGFVSHREIERYAKEYLGWVEPTNYEGDDLDDDGDREAVLESLADERESMRESMD